MIFIIEWHAFSLRSQLLLLLPMLLVCHTLQSQLDFDGHQWMLAYGCNLYSLLSNKLLTIYEYLITNEKWVFVLLLFFFSGVVIEIIMFCLIALCTKLLIESGMGGNSYLGFMYMVNELCYSKLLFDVEIQYIILESNSSVTQR